MKGKIKTYNDKNGFGFILGEDGKDYFFHISKVKSIDNIQRGQTVEFSPAKNEKGLVAENVYIKEIVNFIVIGDTRIKVSNIKSYGISSKDHGIPEWNCDKTKITGMISIHDYNYLYITTYQNDNYTFTDKEIDIYKKCLELDEILK